MKYKLMNEQITHHLRYLCVKHVFNMISMFQMCKSMNKHTLHNHITKSLNVKFIMEPIMIINIPLTNITKEEKHK
jgi:hypothetical protein